MNDSNPTTRRRFVKTALGAAAIIPVVTFAGRAGAQDMPKLEASDAQAVALKYTHDATASERLEDTQICGNCVQYTGEEGSEWGPCNIFPGKAVAAAGWCAVYTKKA